MPTMLLSRQGTFVSVKRLKLMHMPCLLVYQILRIYYCLVIFHSLLNSVSKHLLERKKKKTAAEIFHNFLKNVLRIQIASFKVQLSKNITQILMINLTLMLSGNTYICT